MQEQADDVSGPRALAGTGPRRLWRTSACLFSDVHCLAITLVTLGVVAEACGEYATSRDAFAAADRAGERQHEAEKQMDRLRERNERNNDKIRELATQIEDLYQKRKQALHELAAGMYCSECKRTASEIEAEEKRPFADHLRKVKGHAIPATQKMLEEKAASYDRLIERLEERIEACRETYDGLARDYGHASALWDEAQRARLTAVRCGNYLQSQEEWRAVNEATRREAELRELWRTDLRDWMRERRDEVTQRLQERWKQLEDVGRKIYATGSDAERGEEEIDADFWRAATDVPRPNLSPRPLVRAIRNAWKIWRYESNLLDEYSKLWDRAWTRIMDGGGGN